MSKSKHECEVILCDLCKEYVRNEPYDHEYPDIYDFTCTFCGKDICGKCKIRIEMEFPMLNKTQRYKLDLYCCYGCQEKEISPLRLELNNIIQPIKILHKKWESRLR